MKDIKITYTCPTTNKVITVPISRVTFIRYNLYSDWEIEKVVIDKCSLCGEKHSTEI